GGEWTVSPTTLNQKKVVLLFVFTVFMKKPFWVGFFFGGRRGGRELSTTLDPKESGLSVSFTGCT
ncbi:hypothetical protein, partial [Escherichia coli]|uniref:hypothetical protein n=1 Tax=Escherichia coli TaxID=562 RepID=UPI003D33D1F5